MIISIPAGGENPPTKEPPEGKTPVQQESLDKEKKRTNLEHPDKIKEITPLNPIQFLP